MKQLKQLCELRLEMGRQLGLRDKNQFACLWVVDFPMFEAANKKAAVMARVTTRSLIRRKEKKDIPMLDNIRQQFVLTLTIWLSMVLRLVAARSVFTIRNCRLKMFEILGSTPERHTRAVRILMNAFKFGAPPHGGLA